MESAQAKYSEQRHEDVSVPIEGFDNLTKEETLATRGMSLQWSSPSVVEQTEPVETEKPADAWMTLAKRKQGPKTGHKKKTN